MRIQMNFQQHTNLKYYQCPIIDGKRGEEWTTNYHFERENEKILINIQQTSISHKNDGDERNKRMTNTEHKDDCPTELLPLFRKGVVNGELIQQPPMVYLNDGVSRVDFVMTYKEEQEEEESEEREKRLTFCTNLEEKGLVLEHQSTGDHVFIKIHAPFNILYKTALKMKMKFPVMESETPTLDGCFLKKFMSEIDRDENIYIVDVLDSPFNPNKFIHTVEEHDFFTVTERHYLVHQVMKSTRFGDKDDDIGVENALHENVFDSVYPLHEGPLLRKFVRNSRVIHREKLNERQRLQIEWASYKQMFKFQPISSIRQYFGEKVGFYFAWLGWYTTFLAPAATVGLMCFIYGVTMTFNDVIVDEVCRPDNRTIIICPVCNKNCPYHPLQSRCKDITVAHFFDNNSTIFYAIFMSLWATLFLAFWKRKQTSLAYKWHTSDFSEEEELPRPMYCVRTRERIDIETGESKKLILTYQWRRAIAAFIVLLSCAVVVFVNVVLIIGLGDVLIGIFGNNDHWITVKYSGPIKSVIIGIIGLIIILVSERIYKTVAVRLTDWENPKTESEYHNSLLRKEFWFSFINMYGSLFYIAFMKMDFVPGQAFKIFGKVTVQGCSRQGCFVDLSIQLIIIMVGKQFAGNIQELLIPLLALKWRRRKTKKLRRQKTKKSMYDSQWILDHDCKRLENNALYSEYLEMVIQYGFVTMFVAAFQLAPLFALINNLVEIRLDAIKYICLFRRPVPTRSQDIGAWYGILKTITKLSTYVNAFIIAFTSSWIPRIVYKYRYSPDTSYKGFTEFSLSYFNVSDFKDDSRPVYSTIDQPYCRFPGFHTRKYPYERNDVYWVILAARLAFVVSFQAFVWLMTSFMNYLIPDIPHDIKVAIKKEKEMIKKREEEIERMGM